VRVICPVVAPDGTVVTISVLVALVTVAVTPLNLTTSLAIAVSKPVPVMVTFVPTEPLEGEKLVIEGVTVKSDDDVAVRLPTVTLIRPVVAPDGTVATISVLVALVTVAEVPLNATELLAAVVLKFSPVMVTDVPAVPPDGEKLDMVGALLPQPDRIRTANDKTMVMCWRNPDKVNMKNLLSLAIGQYAWIRCGLSFPSQYAQWVEPFPSIPTKKLRL
jgi:hypothetical protein